MTIFSRCVVAATLALMPHAAAAQGEAPDLAALIECRSDVQGWNALAFSLMEGPGAAEALGWRARASDNPFLQEYDLPAIRVFGRETGRVALTATGPMAVLEGISPAELATVLGITPVVSSADKFLGEKVVVDRREEDGGTVYVTRIALNVSSVTTHPGLTFAGCSYVLEAAAVR